MKFFNLTLLALATTLAMSAPLQAETLTSTLAAAQASSPQLVAARQGQAEAHAQVDQARAAFGATVSLSANAGLNRFEAQPLVHQQTFQPRGATLSMSLPLYTSVRLEAQLAGSHSREEAARAAADQARQSVLFNAANAYLSVARASRLEELAQQHEHLLDAELDRARAELKNGLRTRTDTAQAEARLAAARAQVRSASATLQGARIQYQAAVGRLPEGVLDLPEVAAPADRAEVISAVLAGNAQLQSSAASQSGYRAQTAAARAANRTSVSLTAAMSNDRESNPVMPSESSRSVMLHVSIPLFDSGLNKAQVSQAVAQQSRAQAEHEALEIQVRADAESAWELLQSADAQLSAREQQARAAQVALEGARAEYKAGTRTLLDVLNAEQEVLSARTDDINTRFERVSSVLRIQALQGQLSAQ